MSCEHFFNAAYCDRCGKYLGETCEFCGEWSDGGDHMASQEELWCQCTVEELEEFRTPLLGKEELSVLEEIIAAARERQQQRNQEIERALADAVEQRRQENISELRRQIDKWLGSDAAKHVVVVHPPDSELPRNYPPCYGELSYAGAVVHLYPEVVMDRLYWWVKCPGNQRQIRALHDDINQTRDEILVAVAELAADTPPPMSPF